MATLVEKWDQDGHSLTQFVCIIACWGTSLQRRLPVICLLSGFLPPDAGETLKMNIVRVDDV